MKRIILALLLGFSGIVLAQDDAKTSALLADAMNVYRDSIQQKYGLAALVRHNGKISRHAIGIAGEGIAMTPDKVFNIGSLTKTFTAVLVMQEVEKGSLKLSDSIGKFFDENPNADLTITIEELLLHRSGLGEVVVDSIFNQAFLDPAFEYNYTFLYNKIPKPAGLRGEKYNYCNTNYLLLGYILEYITDKPYDELLKERVFDPCGMKNTYAYFSKAIPNTAHPMYEGEDLIEYCSFHFYKNYSFSAGGISSTMDDLVKFFENLYEKNTLVTPETFAKMVTFRDYYGYGFEKIIKDTTAGRVDCYGHAGDNISFALRNYYNPNTKDLVIVFANHYGDPYSRKIATVIMKQL